MLRHYQKWRRIWREGLTPRLSRAGLLALQSALLNDDPRLLQGTTCYPPMLDIMRERAVQGTCALACRFFLNWYDDTPRQEMRRELLAEVTRSLQQHAAIAA